MKITKEKLKQILLEGNYLEEKDWKKVEQSTTEEISSIMDYLVEEELLTKDLVGQAIAEFLGVPYADLNSQFPSKEQVLKIPQDIADKYRVVVFSEDQKSLVIATNNPEDKALANILPPLFPGKEIFIVYSLEEDIDRAMNSYRQSLSDRFSKIFESNQRIAPEIIEEILLDAIELKVSDIHFEPSETEVLTRFRIDGVLKPVGHIPKMFYENIVNRIKVQSHLRTDEHFSAQDGSIRYLLKNSQKPINLRVSIVPTLDGEKIVIRILSNYVKDVSFSQLGLEERHQELIQEASKKPFGMVLATGPTGSGKTTTLYAILKKINNSQVNIATIEDPVEYKIPGVNHIQVKEETNLTFSKGLRSIVRQDPDIILLGEIRDNETAEIATNAALTGHLLFSTFHANDASTAIPRLLDMGVEPFLLSSTLELIIAQRLVRKICESCRFSYSIKSESLLKGGLKLKSYFSGVTNLYKGKGCPVCNHSGYDGRVGVFEIIEITAELKELMLKNPSSREIWQLARKQGAVSMFEDGLMKVKNGTTTLEEVYRVAQMIND